MGLTTNGLEIRRLPEVIADLVTALQANVDPNINTDDDTLLGQINTVFAEFIASQEALAQVVYDSSNILTAEGDNLDKLAALIGVTRAPAIKSRTDFQAFTGDDEQVVALGSILQNPINSIRYLTTLALTLSISDASRATMTVQSVLNSTAYSFNVNSTGYTFTSDGTATGPEILTGLKAAVDADGAKTWTATIVDSELVITTSNADNVSLTALVNLLPAKATNVTSAEAQNTGVIDTPTGVVNSLVIPVADSTVNLQPYITGRAEETDEELRARILTSQQIGGKATLEAITDNLLAIDEVTRVLITENTTASTVGGIPPHSFEPLVEGGADADIALVIWDNKPAGITSHGSTSVVIHDSQSYPHTIEFTRPTIINLAFRVTYTIFDTDLFPSNGEALIAASIKSTTNLLGLGGSVIPTRYFGPIYESIKGINSLVVEVQEIPASGDAPSSGSWQTTTLNITGKERAKTELVDIELVEG